MSLIIGSSVAVLGNSAPTGAAGSTPIQSSYNTVTSASTLTVTFSSNTTAGNTIVVCIGSAGTINPIVSSISLTGSTDTFYAVKSFNNNTFFNAEIWYDTVCAGGHTSVVINFVNGTGTTQLAAEIYEIPGAIQVDKSSGNAASAATWTSNASATTTQAKEIWFGASLTGTSNTVTGAWTSTLNTPAGAYGFAAAYQIVTSTGAATFSGTAANGPYTSVVATFYPANKPNTSLVISPPAGYANGQTFLMAAIGGNTTGVVTPSTPPGWLSMAGGGIDVFYRTVTGSESPYTVTFASKCICSGIYCIV